MLSVVVLIALAKFCIFLTHVDILVVKSTTFLTHRAIDVVFTAITPLFFSMLMLVATSTALDVPSLIFSPAKVACKAAAPEAVTGFDKAAAIDVSRAAICNSRPLIYNSIAIFFWLLLASSVS